MLGRTLSIGSLLVMTAGCAAAIAPAPAVETATVGAPMAIAPLASARPAAVVPAGAFLFYDDFEHGTSHWSFPSPAPQDVAWRLLHEHTCTGDYSMMVGRDGRDPFLGPAPDATLTLVDPLDLRTAHAPVLKYDVLGEAVPADGVELQTEIQVGNGDWQTLDQPVVAGFDYARTYATDLTPWAGQQIHLRFRASVKAMARSLPAVYLDEVGVIETSTH